MKLKTMRIKKIYFDQIASGEKTIEYRSQKPFYDWLSDVELPFMIRFHYQSGDFIYRVVEKVIFGKRPKSVDPTLITEKCWHIYLSDHIKSK